MELEVKINNKLKKLELISQEDEIYTIRVDDEFYEVIAVKTTPQVYSVLLDNISYTLEIAKTDFSGKKFNVSTKNYKFMAKVIDAQTKYQQSRKQENDENSSDIISTPMPGQVIKIMVAEGQKVKSGDTIIIVEAMKMQSEYKASNDRIVKEILVEEGDKIKGHQPLVILEKE